MNIPTSEATDAGVIVEVLRILDAGWTEPISDGLMPGLHFCSWHGYIAVNDGGASKLNDVGRSLLAKLGVLCPERAA